MDESLTAALALGGPVQKCTGALFAVHAAELAPDRLPLARELVGMFVSRDTILMDASDLYRFLAESVSENFNNTFVPPYF
jgi:cobalamin biosynthesis protein CobD/CbiB